MVIKRTYQSNYYHPPQSQQPTHSQTNELLSVKSWNKFDKTFMAFGSICNSLQKANKEDIEWAWDFAKGKVGELVEEIYQKDLPF